MLPSSQSRLVGLDILRVFAILLVMGRHYPGAADAPDFWKSLAAVIQAGGWIGVDLFFVLSGFLVSGLLFREHLANGSVHVGRFLVRRAFKIYPAFWVMIGGVLLFRFMNGTKVEFTNLLSELLFVQNYLPALCGHTWTLAVEEQFYIFLAVLVVWLVRSGLKRPFAAIPFIFFTMAIACLALRAWQRTTLVTFDSFKHLYPGHLRIDSLMFGVLLSYWWHMKAGAEDFARLRRWSWPLILVSLLGLVPAFFSSLVADWWVPVFGFSLFYIACGGLLLGVLGLGWPEKSNLVRFTGWMGAHSYSVYLWHSFVFYGLFNTLTRISGYTPHRLVGLAWFLIMPWVIGIVMAKLVEMPVLKFRDKFFPSLSTKKNQSNISPNVASIYAAQA